MTALEYLTNVPASGPTLMQGVVYSSLFHLFLFLLLIGIPGIFLPQRTYFSSTYMVRLVDAPAGKPGGVKVSQREAKRKMAVEEPVKEKPVEKKKTEEKKGVTLTVKDKAEKKTAVLPSPKKTKAKESEKDFSLALNKIKERVGERRRKEELEKIREKIAQGEETGAGIAGASGAPFGKGMIANLPLNYQLYYQTIEQKVKSNWNLPLPRGVIEDMKGMEVVLSIKIRSDGEIVETSFEQKSGNIYLDDSAFRAIKKSNPLPSFAEYNIRESFFETGIIFPAGELL